MLRLLIICILLNIAYCHKYLSENGDLHTKLQGTAIFFQKLKTDYALLTPGEDTLSEINREVSKYVSNTLQEVSVRRKRDTSVSETSEKGIDVLLGFEDRHVFKRQNIRDINFFSFPNEKELVAFAVILNTSNIFLIRLNDETVDQIGSYPSENSISIIVDSCIAGAFLITQKETGEIVVSRLKKQGDTYNPYRVQDFESSGVTNLATWHGMNQLYLGMSSASRISIFTWLGEHFDLVQDLHLGAQKLYPFYSKGFMHLAAIGSKTTILRYSLRSNKFIAIQTLPGSQDVSSFHMKEGHFVEYFLSLSTESSVILYKELYDRYVPFQQIPSGNSGIFFLMKKSILFFTLENEAVVSYQYDGWKFVQLDARIENVRQIRRVQVLQEEYLLIEHTNNTWKLVKPTWTSRILWRNLQDEIKTWCIKTKIQAQNRMKELPKLEDPLKILNGHVDTLFAHHLNGHNGIDLTRISKKLTELESALQKQNQTMAHSKNYTSVNFMHAKKVRVRCGSKCAVAELNVDSDKAPYNKLKELQQSFKNYVDSFRQEYVEKLNCPRVAIPTDNLYVTKLLNGVSLNDFKTNLLKVTGDQEITGAYTFENLSATRVRMPIDIASTKTSEEVQTREIRIKELNITDGGLLMPLNGPLIIAEGRITAPKVTVKTPILLQGKLTGQGTQRINPFLFISESMNLIGDYTLQNVTVENLLNTTDIVSPEGKSVGDTLENLIPLEDNVSVPLILLSEKTKWKNVTLHNHPDWITANSGKKLIIRGQKRILHNVTVTEEIYNRIRFPKIKKEVCAIAAIAPEIQRSLITIDNITAKQLASRHIYGKIRNKNLIFGPPVRCFKNEKIIVKNLSIESFDIQELKTFANAWTPPNIYKGPVHGKHLTVDHLHLPVTLLPVFLPETIRNMVSKKNVTVKKINDVDWEHFLENAVNVEESLTLGNVTFAKGFLSNTTYARNLMKNSSSMETNLHLGEKRILGNLQAKSVELLFNKLIPSTEELSNITIKGNAIFSTGPVIKNINGRNLKDLSEKIWTRNKNFVFTGKNLHMANVSLGGSSALNKFNTEGHGPWKDIPTRVLSRMKSQVIKVNVSIDEVEAPSITSTQTSRIICASPTLIDMLNNTLMKDRVSVVKTTWRFDKLNVSGNLFIDKKINSLNLKRDVVRRDSKTNIITEKKTVMELATKDLHALNFNEWSENALTQKKRKLAVIKGQKKFNSIAINNLNVSGTIMGREMDQVLLKSADQTIFERRTIDGSINASGILIDGQINDVNLSHLMHYQLKAQKPVQRIEGQMEFLQDLQILGNLTIDGLFGDHFRNDSYERIVSMSKEIVELWQAAEAIDIALQNRAIYINKLQVIEDTIDFGSENDTKTDISTNGEYQCELKNLTVVCNEEPLIDLSFSGRNKSDFVLIKLLLLNDLFFTIAVQRDVVSVYMIDNVQIGFSRVSDLHVQDIIEAYVEPYKDSIWIALQLPLQTLVLRYEKENHFQEYLLPESKVFLMSRAPNGQLFLLLSDGVWNFEGLGSPKNILEMKFFGKVETFARGGDYYIRNTVNNNSTLFKFRYIGN